MSRLSRAAWLYMAVVVTAAILLLAHVLVQDMGGGLDHLMSRTLLVLALLFLLCDLLRPACEPESAQRMIGSTRRNCIRLPAALLD